jgi:hypothetical protein
VDALEATNLGYQSRNILSRTGDEIMVLSRRSRELDVLSSLFERSSLYEAGAACVITALHIRNPWTGRSRVTSGLDSCDLVFAQSVLAIVAHSDSSQ